MDQRTGIVKKMMTHMNQCKQFVHQYTTIEKLVFSKEVHHHLANCGFVGWMIPEELGGQGKTAKELIATSEILMTYCENLGLLLSWIIHEIVTWWFIDGFGSADQKKKYLPKIISGNLLGAIAISEPDVGPHPKHLKTRAKISENYFCMNGEKTYLTNGPVADIFIVIAITHMEENARKHYSAFIVTNDLPGFRYTEPLNFPFVKTSPHGGIVLENCMIPKTNLLGEINTAYDLMVKPFREIEDTLMMGPILGGMQCQLNYLTHAINQGHYQLDHAQLENIGKLQTIISSGRAIAEKSGHLLDDKNPSIDLLLGFRHWAEFFHICYAGLIAQLPEIETDQMKSLTNDLCGIGRVAAKIMQKKQMDVGKQLVM
jgi:acyl-CoA dehydrogenase